MHTAVRLLSRSMPDYSWVGIYLLDGNELVLGPFAGKPSPHTRIPLGRGICGAAAAEEQTIIVDDVNADPRYLACSLETRSEIVVPIMDGDGARRDRHRQRSTGGIRTGRSRLLEQIAQHLAPRLHGYDLRSLHFIDPILSMAHTITLIPGDGIGPEVTAGGHPDLHGGGLDIDWERHDAGVDRVQAVRPVAAGRRCSNRSGATRSRSRGR